MKLFIATSPDDFLEGEPKLLDLPDENDQSILPVDSGRRESSEGSAFWPELDPAKAADMVDKGYGDSVALAREVSLELTAMAARKGWAVPQALRDRAVFEVSKILVAGNSPRDRLRAAETLERMVRANNAPNALPEQLNPSGPSASPTVQVNVQNNLTAPHLPPSSEPSVSVQELVDELLSRSDVQSALDADLPTTDFDYGM